ncbi:hypothetical protein NM208_g16286 [Fusarium decemcellulare]|uniref:Uncharacterized protein n=1 Tax=Fusarium decemcellulare TaxID=57161 RepID=A0ACC1RB64_9HYPO|nr:hypothetical protein NM208_g16286 [Fusarium decemcellulare]
MFRRYALGFSSVGRQFSTMSSSSTPVEDVIRAKITAAFDPQTLEIYNDSHLHAHHKAMQGSTSSETHFRCSPLVIAWSTSLLRDEMAQEGGIHALQLRTLTPEEEQRQKKKKEDDARARAAAEEEEST